MKKGKVFGRKQLVLAGLVLCLGAAVWINMRFAPNGDVAGNGLGNSDYVADGNNNLGEAIQTGAKVSSIEKSKFELKATRDELVKTLNVTIDKAGQEDSVKKSAVDQLSKLTENINKEAAIETIIKSKGFTDVLVIIAEDSTTVMVGAEELLQSQTLQIQDAVVSQTGASLDKIKIITVK